MLDVAAGAELSQTGLMHVKGPRPDRVAAGQCDLGPLATADQRTQHAHRGPELPDSGEIGVVLGFVGGRDANRAGIQFDVGA